MTYGSATTADQVAPYFTSIYGDRASAELIADFENRYRLVGQSPLIEITEQQATHLGETLGADFVVRAGMRHSEPTIARAITDCRDAGCTKLVGIILSPQFSSFIMQGYTTAFTDAALAAGFTAADIAVADPWPTESHFIELLTKRVTDGLATLRETYDQTLPVIFTTHSMPKRIVDSDTTYMAQLTATIDAVRTQLDPTLKWYAAYQSAGHSPEEWLKPDLTDILDILKTESKPAALIVPIQFLTNHLEILYDLDIAGKEQCVERGIAYHRIELPNTHPLFIASLAATAHRTVATL